MQRILKWSLVLGLPISIGVCYWLGKSWWSWAVSPPLPVAATGQNVVQTRNVEIKIPDGTAMQQIGAQLEGKGLIRSRLAWNLWGRWLHWHNPQGGFKAGTYELSPTEPLPAIASTIWQGKVVTRSYTIPEGWSLRQMAEYFAAQGFFSAQDFLKAARVSDHNRYPWLPTNLSSLEGFLYPDTYKLNGDTITPQGVVQQMLDEFAQKALPLYQQGKNHSQLNLLQWVTLASLVEKEAVIPAERPQIAGVFINRLQRHMLLESDPTVEYALGVRQTATQPLTLNQVKTPSLYNTYLHPGLPPAPIASPGLASLKAALYPQSTPYLYFVARYDGTHVFSRTLSQHLEAQATIQHQQKEEDKETGR